MRDGSLIVSPATMKAPERAERTTLRHNAPKVGRNDLCPCGSGRKYEKCCGAPDKLN